jgi:signal transduction histidine kinase
MGPIADALLVAGVLAGATLCWFGYRVYRMPERLGRRAFVAFTGILGVGCIVSGAVGLGPSLLGVDQAGWPWGQWEQFPLLFWLVSALPWFVFGLQYTGTRTQVRRRTVALLAVPHLFVVLDLTLSLQGQSTRLLGFLATVAFVYIISIAVGGSYLLLQAAYARDHVPLGQGIGLGIVAVGTLAVWNLITTTAEPAPVVRAGAYAAGSGLLVLGIGAALLRYGAFESTPSVAALGERALTRETDDLMFVVDDGDRVVELNETATETLGVARAGAIGAPLTDLLDDDTGSLRDAETVTLGTAAGTRRYDPQVSAVRDPHDNSLGAMLSLRDVTGRELREQRLAVLNRVLRHNLRNEADVVKSHAEALDASPEHVAAIDDAADAIAALGRRAQRIDEYVADAGEDARVDLSAVVRSVLETVGAEDATVAVSVDLPTEATLVTNRGALVSALESALDNALSYADSRVAVAVENRPDGCRIEVSDDGPGIPEWELDSLDAGDESPLEHSTGLGLWQLKWAVVALNGDLSFDTTDGTTVDIVVPDRADRR